MTDRAPGQHPRARRRGAMVAAAVVPIALAGWLVNACSKPSAASPIDGARAFAHVRKMVEFGPRPPGSSALAECRSYIVKELTTLGLSPRVDSFRDEKNAPGIEFHNIECEIPGARAGEKRVLVLGSHYDTKIVGPDAPDPTLHFVGANDAGSSSGLLIELARYFKQHPLPCGLLLVWFDGEESIPWDWDDARALFGSRRSVAELSKRFSQQFANTSEAVPCMVLLDMVGHKDLAIIKDPEANPEVFALFEETVSELGYEKYFFQGTIPNLTDDHIPFRDRGIRVIDLIQFGRDNHEEWWHTANDTMDILSAESLAIVGHVVAEALPRLAAKFYPPPP